MSRPRGFANWKPKQETQIVLAQVQDVLDEYRNFLPLTARQIFYRMVGKYGYDKTERAYARLCEYLVRARRAQMIPFDAIRDDGTTHNEYLRYTSPTAFWEHVSSNAEHYRRDKLEDQPVYVELWCEAAGMVPQLERVAGAYSIPVYSTGGFSSVTVTYEIADRALARDKATVFLHVGDYDPSGESIFTAMTEDARQFLYNRLIWDLRKQTAGLDKERAKGLLGAYWPDDRLYPLTDLPDDVQDLRPVRVALTEEQVDEYELPTAPPKATDTRSASWSGETCQLEALPPDVLADVIEEAIRDVLDYERLEAMWEIEREERGGIKERVAAIIEENETE